MTIHYAFTNYLQKTKKEKFFQKLISEKAKKEKVSSIYKTEDSLLFSVNNILYVFTNNEKNEDTLLEIDAEKIDIDIDNQTNPFEEGNASLKEEIISDQIDGSEFSKNESFHELESSESERTVNEKSENRKSEKDISAFFLINNFVLIATFDGSIYYFNRLERNFGLVKLFTDYIIAVYIYFIFCLLHFISVKFTQTIAIQNSCI